MLDEAFVLWLHFLGFMTLFAAALGQLYLYTPRIQAGNVGLMLLLSAMLLCAGFLVVATGAMLWLDKIEAGRQLASNPLFLFKLGMYGGVMILALAAGWRLLAVRQWADQLQDQQTVTLPAWLKIALLAQLIAIGVLPFFGTLVALGHGNG